MNDDQLSNTYEQIANHIHDGNLSQRINLYDLFGFIDTVTAAPTEAPSNIYGQFKIYSGILYVYDFINNVWRPYSSTGMFALFDHYADANNATTTETDLYSDTIAAGKLAANGDKIFARYQGTFTGAAAASQDLRVYFGGTKIYDSGALSIGVATDNWTLETLIIRESSSVVRCSVSVSSDFATLFPYSAYTRITGLTLANTEILKLTGQAAGAGAASNQITATLGTVSYQPAA